MEVVYGYRVVLFAMAMLLRGRGEGVIELRGHARLMDRLRGYGSGSASRWI